MTSGGQGKRVLITGVSRFLGLRLAKRLEGSEGIASMVGVDLEEPPVPIKGLEFIRADIQSPLIARVIEATKTDTIVHTNIGSNPARLGGRSRMKEINVIGTMQLLAAAQRAERVKKVVMKSSAAVYGSGPAEPSLIPEGHAARQVDLAGYGKDCADAEQYARDFGRRRPDVGLVILRTQNVVGPTVRTSITDYLSLPIVPTALGFDPRLQLLHEADAVEALVAGVFSTTSGIFNVAGDGVVYLSKALRLLDRPELPLFLPVARTAASVLRSAGLIDFPIDQLKVIIFGRVLSTERSRTVLGFEPHWSTEDTLLDFRAHREPDAAVSATGHPAWERELFDYLKRRDTRERETV